MEKRVYNFSPGPAVLPLPVLEEAQRDLLALPGIGISALEISHRSAWFDGVLAETDANLRKLLGIGSDYKIVFLQGGSRLQFSMLPMNFLRGTEGSADYIVTGTWGKTALQEAQREGRVRAAYDGKSHNFSRLPRREEVQLDPQARYVHLTTNETIQGVQYPAEPDYGPAPLVCDASSDFLCRPLEMSRYSLVYACAQKNAGPAGVTIAILRDDFLERIAAEPAPMLDYRTYVREKSLQNTPPVFAIYLVLLVTRWLDRTIGGLAAMHRHNQQKAKLLYDAIDASEGFYAGHAEPASRSLMNVTFRLGGDEVQDRFLREAKAQGLAELKGHRSVGGIRASIYNAMPLEGVQALRQFMDDFRRRHA